MTKKSKAFLLSTPFICIMLASGFFYFDTSPNEANAKALNNPSTQILNSKFQQYAGFLKQVHQFDVIRTEKEDGILLIGKKTISGIDFEAFVGIASNGNLSIAGRRSAQFSTLSQGDLADVYRAWFAPIQVFGKQGDLLISDLISTLEAGKSISLVESNNLKFRLLDDNHFMVQ